MVNQSKEQIGKSRWASYAAVAWCILFGALHLYWALGGNVLLAQFSTPPNQTIALARAPGYIGMIWGVVAACTLGAVVALATIYQWGRHIPQWILLTILWIACALSLVRGIGNPTQTLLLIWGVIPAEALGGPISEAWYEWMLVDAVLFSPWFRLGGVAFGVTAWLARRREEIKVRNLAASAGQA